MTLRACIVDDAVALDALVPAWEALWRRAPTATVFQSPHWLLPWWRAFHPGDLFVVTVHDGERLVALAPLYIEHGPYGRRILPLGISVSDYLDVLLDPAAPQAGEALMAHIDSGRARWDAFDLEELGPGSAALRLPTPEGWEEHLAPQSACPVLTLGADPERLGGHVPRSKLRNLNLSRNRLARRNGVAVTMAGEGDAGAFLDDLIRLHGARWATRGEAGVLADDTVRSFHADALPRLIRIGLARCYRITIEGHEAGAFYGLLDGSRAFYYLTGFDPTFAFESPGTALVGYAIEDAVRAGCREFHFLRGQEAYKYDWGAVDRWNHRRSFHPALVHA